MGEKGEVGSSVHGIDMGSIHGEEDGGLEDMGEVRFYLKKKDECVWWSLSLGMSRGKFGSSIVRWDYPKRRGEKAMWKKGRNDNTLIE